MDNGKTDVLVIGAGPAGLAAALELRRRGIREILVLDREDQAGGIPRQCHQIGFGLRDIHRVFTGRRYAKHYVQRVKDAGIDIRVGTMVTGWQGANTLEVTSPAGRYTLEAQSILLATGCRECARAARKVPGPRPKGIFTTGMLQRFVNLDSLPVGKRAVIIGAELVSFSAISALVKADVKVIAISTEQPTHQGFWFYKLITSDLRRIPVIGNSRLVNIFGKRRVEAIELADQISGHRWQIDCDTIVFTGNWIPENELADLGGLILDPGTRGPRVDQVLRTSVKGVFAAGNLLHGAEPAEVAALEGRHAAVGINKFLKTGYWGAEEDVPITYAEPIQWVFPGLIAKDHSSAPRSRITFRTTRFFQSANLQVWQENTKLYEKHFRRLVPNRSNYLQDSWIDRVVPSKGNVRFIVRE